ncbi:MAG: D-2-hydroxyacid dehydrogenase [Anaerolineae bacterium]|nr:D-2-hydroxyacid dehydrogenase [Anaerolineae bacterium]
MRIVVLDGYPLNPGDLSWEALEALGECEVYDQTSPELIVERAGPADIVLTNKVILNREILERLPKLRFVSVTATGYDVVDVDAARERGIPVSNVPTYGTTSVVQMTFAHLLNLTQHVAYHAETVRRGRWSESDTWCYWDYPLVELAGLTLGIIGFGRIGRASAALAKAFGMQVIAYDAYVTDSGDPEIEMVALDRVFAESDVLTLHCPLTPETEGLVDKRRLSQMKRSAFLINTSRGPVVNNVDLAEALNAGVIAGAGLDVLDVEPPEADHPLLQAKNVHITPHISWATRSARARLLRTAIANVQAYLEGEPVHIVNAVAPEAADSVV